MTRINLLQATTFTVAPSGPSLQSTWDALVADYDLRGKNVVIQMADGVYTHGLVANGAPPGHRAFGQITIRGNLANPGACIIRPVTGPALQFSNGAKAFVEGVTLDTHAADADALISTIDSEVGVGKVVFGRIRYPRQHIQVGERSRVFIYAGYTIQMGGVLTVANAVAGSNVIGVGSPAGILPYMGVSAPFLTDGCWVESLGGPNNCQITLGGGEATQTVSAGSVTFNDGAQAHIQADFGGSVDYVSTPATPLTMTMYGKPHFHSGFIVTDGAPVRLQAARYRLPSGAAAEASGPPFVAYHGGWIKSEVTLPDGVTPDLAHLPGSRVVFSATFAAGDTVIGITAYDAARIRRLFAGRVGLAIAGAGIEPGTVVPSIDSVGTTTLRISRPTLAAASGLLTLAGFTWSGGEYMAHTAHVGLP